MKISGAKIEVDCPACEASNEAIEIEVKAMSLRWMFDAYFKCSQCGTPYRSVAAGAARIYLPMEQAPVAQPG